MKKILVLLAILCVSFSVFAGGANESSSPAGKRVVLVVPNNLGDKAFSDLVWSGVQKAKDQYGISEIKCIELLGDASIQESTLSELCEDGDWDYIVTGTSSMTEAIANVTLKYTNQKFIVYDTELSYEGGIRKNCVSYMCMQNEGSFLGGVMAALMTSDTSLKGVNKEKTIGFIGGKEGTSIKDFLVGYIEGMQAVDPECKILVSFVGSYTDAAKAKELAIAQYNQGADIIFAVCSGAGLGIYEAAYEQGKWAIGVDSDQASQLEETSPEIAWRIPTSVVKNFDVVLCNALGDAINGTLDWGYHYKVTIADGGIGLSENKYYESIVPQSIRDKISEFATKVASGEISVTSAYDLDLEQYEAIKQSAIKK